MVAQLGLRLGKWLYKKGQIKEEQVDVIRYAIEIICSEFAEVIFIIFYGCLTVHVMETVLYLLFFHSLRHMYQGYHAKTIFKCFVLTTGSYLLSLLVYNAIVFPIIIFFLILSLIIQVDYCLKKKEIKPFLVSALFWVLSFSGYFIFDVKTPLQLLSIINLIVSIALIPERRCYI